MKTEFLQGDDAAITIADGSCDACLKALSESYDLDSWGNVEVYAVEDSDGNLIGFLCQDCGDLQDPTNAIGDE